MREPDVREKMTALGLEIWNESPNCMTDLLRSDYEKYGKLAREVGITKPASSRARWASQSNRRRDEPCLTCIPT